MVTARRREGPRAGGRDNPSPRPCQHAAGDQYRHRARRLRAQFHGQPALLQQSLRALSRDCDAAGKARPASLVTPALTAVFEVPEETTRRFSRMVRDRVEGQILRFDERQLLIRAAHASDRVVVIWSRMTLLAIAASLAAPLIATRTVFFLTQVANWTCILLLIVGCAALRKGSTTADLVQPA